jgi:hypothetical protein
VLVTLATPGEALDQLKSTPGITAP